MAAIRNFDILVDYQKWYVCIRVKRFKLLIGHFGSHLETVIF